MMKEHENSLTPEAIDKQTERWSHELSSEEYRLIQGLYASSQAYSQENERSLERIWRRFVQTQEQPVLLQEQQPKEPGDKQLFMEGKAMRDNEIYQGMQFSTLTSQPVKRPHRSLWRAVSIGVAAAVVLITILSWAVISYGLRNGQHQSTANNTHTTRIGVTQKDVSSGTLLCSFSDDNSAQTLPLQPTLDWSSHGQIATTYANLKTFSAHNCAQAFSSSSVFTQATWSPDGRRLLVRDGTDEFGTDGFWAEVLDASTGRVIAHFNNNVNHTSVSQSVWLSSGTQIVSAVASIDPSTGSTGPVSLQVWDASNGRLIRTALTFGADKRLLGFDVDQLPISPDGKYVAMINSHNTIEVWNIGSGKLVSTIPFGQSDVSALAWSPNGASLALGLFHASEVQIWSIASKHMSASFMDSDASIKVIGALAWSPDGKYLAESGSDIHIWDVRAQKIVATFGRVDKVHWIATLAWSPDSRMLASSTNHIVATGDQKSATQNTVQVWKLS